MNLKSIMENSIFVQNWLFLLITILIIIVFNYLLRTKKCENGKHKKTASKEKLDGEEYVGASFTQNTEHGVANEEDEEQDECYTPALEEKEHVRYDGAKVQLPGGAYQFYEMVNNRRSVRSFNRTPKPALSVIEDCIRAAGTAPSGAHTEPWTFCVVEDAQLKEQIRDIVEAEELLNYEQRMHRQWTADLRPLRTDHIKQYLTDAPYLVLVFKQTYGQTATGARKQHYYHEISVAIATGILLCALQAAGLSSLVTTPLNCGPALRTLLARPVNEKLMVLLPVGYAAENCRVPDLKRKHLNDILVKY